MPLGEKDIVALQGAFDEQTDEKLSKSESLSENFSSNGETNSKQEQYMEKVLHDGAMQNFGGRHDTVTGKVVDSELNMSSSIQVIANVPFRSNFSQAREPARYVQHGKHKTESMISPSDSAVQNLHDLTNDFASTIMLDEELEYEQKTIKKGCLSSMTRIDGEDDEMVVNDQDVERLVVVTQKNEPGEISQNRSKSMSNELASGINDGLYF